MKILVQKIVSKYLQHKYLTGADISEKELSNILREIRISLINSDVSLEVIRDLFTEIKDELLVKKNYSPTQSADVVVFNAIKKKFIKILGESTKELNYSSKRLNKILLIGFNGSGKTTTTAKLAFYAKNKLSISPQVCSLDIYRPGAYEQLQQLLDPVEIPSFKVHPKDLKNFWSGKKDIASSNCFFFDCFGFLSDNDDLLNEAIEIKNNLNPTEVLLVLDAMSGQEILDSVKKFHEKLGITGIVVSKSDSKAHMGGAFSVSYLLKIPIKFLGKGEKIKDLDIFHPERIVSLIFGEGDLLSLAEKMQSETDISSSQKTISRILGGHFDLSDLINQIKEVKKIGSLKSLVQMFPGNVPSPTDSSLSLAEKQLAIWEILISSMTRQERKNPKLFKKQPSRKIRVVKGSGRKPDELNKLLKRWEESKKKIDAISSNIKKGKNPFSSLLGL